jgi:ubiquitin C-terminal hydrolase
MRHGFQIVLVNVNTAEMVPEWKLQNMVSIMLVSGLLLLFSFGTVTCLKCQAKSNTYDPFLDISLDVKNVSTILRALERFVEPETLDTDNAYNCTK